MRNNDYSDDEQLRRTLTIANCGAIDGFRETSDEWCLDTFGIGKRRPYFRSGWSFDLFPESRFYRRWFDFPDLGAKGWAIILRVWDAGSPPNHADVYEKFPGWVPPERVQEADQWITFLNAEIRARLLDAGKTPTDPDPSQGAIPPPLSPDAAQLPASIRQRETK